MKTSWCTVLVLSMSLLEVLLGGCQSPTATTAPVLGTQFVFAEQPAGAIAGALFAIQPIVYVEDENGQIVHGYNGIIVLGITPGTGASGATLSGMVSVDAAGGVAYFANLSIDKAGSGYSLSVLNSSLAPAISNPFDVAAAVTTGS